jgi:hypothetical protein
LSKNIHPGLQSHKDRRRFHGVQPVETTGIEPATSGLQNRRSPN